MFPLFGGLLLEEIKAFFFFSLFYFFILPHFFFLVCLFASTSTHRNFKTKPLKKAALNHSSNDLI
jgi:hypothetical protein